jgi:[acyl-carrier-protein] S-malonyltransferase
MGADLAERFPQVRELFAQARGVLGFDLAEVCFHGPAEKLDSTAVSQPALFVVSLAALLAAAHDSPGLAEKAEAAAGLSLGEYTALAFAGALDFEEGLRLVHARGLAMQAASDAVAGGMVSILGLERGAVDELCRRVLAEMPTSGAVLQVANLLCPSNVVVSGSAEACRRVALAAETAGAMKTIPLAVAGAFHTALMQPAVDRLAACVSAAHIVRPRIPVVSNVDARPHQDPAEIRELLVRQVVSPVRWEDSMRWLLTEGFDSFVEVGPGRVLRGLLRRIDRNAQCATAAA